MSEKNIKIIKLDSNISNQDIVMVSELKEMLESIDVNKYDGVIIDFEQVHYMSSQPLGIILDFNNKLRENNKRMAFCSVNKDMNSVLNILGFQTVIDIFDSLKQAKEFFEKM